MGDEWYWWWGEWVVELVPGVLCVMIVVVSVVRGGGVRVSGCCGDVRCVGGVREVV